MGLTLPKCWARFVVVLFCFVLFVLMRSTEPQDASDHLEEEEEEEEEEECISLVSWPLDLLWSKSS